MARRKKGELPRYRLHKQSGQAVVSLPTGGRPRYRDVLLGPFGSEESHREYTRVINEWLATGRLSPASGPESRRPDLTVAELVLRFWRHAEGHYRLLDGSPSRELEHFKYALMPAVELYGETLAGDFGPLKLKAVRRKMIETRWHFTRLVGEADRRPRWLPECRVRAPGEEGPDSRVGHLEAEWDGAWRPVEILKSRQGLPRGGRGEAQSAREQAPPDRRVAHRPPLRRSPAAVGRQTLPGGVPSGAGLVAALSSASPVAT